MAGKTIQPSDLMDMAAYAQVRKQRRAAMVELKRNRRVEVGPNATFHFESYDTMLHQVHEMLYTERGGEAQMADELAAYNPLIPQGSELVATLMLEMSDPVRRADFLGRLGGIERQIWIELDGEKVPADWERDVERTNAAGKTSSVHFLHFRFTPEQIARFKASGSRAMLVIGHPNYGHAALLSDGVKAELARDLE